MQFKPDEQNYIIANSICFKTREAYEADSRNISEGYLFIEEEILSEEFLSDFENQPELCGAYAYIGGKFIKDHEKVEEIKNKQEQVSEEYAKNLEDRKDAYEKIVTNKDVYEDFVYDERIRHDTDLRLVDVNRFNEKRHNSLLGNDTYADGDDSIGMKK